MSRFLTLLKDYVKLNITFEDLEYIQTIKKNLKAFCQTVLCRIKKILQILLIIKK
jgi:hypothetical protein